MGRPSKPAELKEAQGNLGKRPLAIAPEEQLPVGEAAPPETLDRRAWPIWVSLVTHLQRLKFFRVTDRYALEAYCDAVLEWHLANKNIRREGNVYWTDSKHGKMKRINPMRIVKRDARLAMQHWESQLGLTPRARQDMLLKLASAAQPPLPGMGGEASRPTAPAAPATESEGPTGYMMN